MNPSVKYGKDRWEYLVCNGKTGVGRYLTKKGIKKTKCKCKKALQLAPVSLNNDGGFKPPNRIEDSV